MGNEFFGWQKLINKDAGDGGNQVIIRPPPGTEWLVFQSTMWHDDVGQTHDEWWEITDGVDSFAWAVNGQSAFGNNDLPINYGQIYKFTEKFYAIAHSLTVVSPFRLLTSSVVMARPLNLDLLILEWNSEKLRWKMPPALLNRVHEA